jgi:hypothetical protein
VILILLIILGLLFFFPVTETGLGDEIKGFPIEEMSLTVWSWTTAFMVNVPGIAQPLQYQEYIILNVSLRNIASHEVHFGVNDNFNQELQEARTKNLFLKATYQAPRYGTMTLIVHAETNALDIGWGITPTQKLSSLMPNQSAYGSIYFIMHQGYNPESLICNNTNSELFTVALNK